MARILFNLIFKVFFVAAAAYILYSKGVFTAQDQKSATTILMKLSVYFTVIMSSQQEFSLETARAIAVTGLFAILYFLLGIPSVSKLGCILKLEESKRRVFISSILFCNITFIGYPILQELYGNMGLLCAIMFSMIYNVLFYTWDMALLSGSGRISIRSLFSNKIAVVSVLALIMYFLQVKIPEPLNSTFSVLSALTMPLSMIIIGCNLAQYGIWKIIWDRELYLPTMLRMIVMPAIVFAVMNLLEAEQFIVRVSTVIAALPSGSMTAIVASDYNCAPDYAANIVVQTMLAMLFALPMWVAIVGL